MAQPDGDKEVTPAPAPVPDPPPPPTDDEVIDALIDFESRGDDPRIAELIERLTGDG